MTGFFFSLKIITLIFFLSKFCPRKCRPKHRCGADIPIITSPLDYHQPEFIINALFNLPSKRTLFLNQAGGQKIPNRQDYRGEALIGFITVSL